MPATAKTGTHSVRRLTRSSNKSLGRDVNPLSPRYLHEKTVILHVSHFGKPPTKFQTEYYGGLLSRRGANAGSEQIRTIQCIQRPTSHERKKKKPLEQTNNCKKYKQCINASAPQWGLCKHSLVQWNRFFGVTGCAWDTCIQWRVRTNFTAPGCTSEFTQFCHLAQTFCGWPAKMASIEFWIPWHNADRTHCYRRAEHYRLSWCA